MAEKRTINIDINSNASEAEKDFKSFNKAVDETTKSAKNLDATFEEVYGELQPLTTRMGEAEDRLYELALAGDTASKEYQELLTKVGEYRKVQIQTDLAVDGAATTMTQKLGSALNGATSGFAATQGAMALFGDENEALEESLLKVQSALAIQQGVQGLTEAYRELSIGSKLAAAGQAAFTFVTGGATTGLKLFRAALISTGVGALVVGIGLLVANFDKVKAVLTDVNKGFKEGGLMTKALMIAFMPLIATVKLFQKGLQAIGVLETEQEKTRKANAEEQAKRFEAEGKRHKAAMDNASKEIEAINKAIGKEKERQQALEDTYNLELRKAEGNAEKIEEINKNLAQSKEDSIAKEERLFLESKQKQIEQEEAGIAVFQAIIDANLARGRTDHARELSEVAKRTATLTKLKAKALANDYDEIQAFNVRRENLDLDYEDGVEERRKARNEKYKQYAQERLSIQRQIEDIENSLFQDGIEKELAINEDKFRRLREDAKKNTKLTRKERARLIELFDEQELAQQKVINKKYVDLEKEKNAKIDEINKKENQERIDKEDALFQLELDLMKDRQMAEIIALSQSYEAKYLLAQDNAELTKQLEAQFLIDQAAIEDQFRKEKADKEKAASDKSIAEAQAIQDFKFDIASQGLQTISNLSELFAGKSEKAAKRAFQVQKAVSIAQATIDTYKSANAIFASTAANPITVLNPSAPFIAAGVAVAAGLVNVATIASQQFQGGGSNGGGGSESAPDLGGGAAPQFNVVGDSGINQIAQLQQQPVQAYVVSGEVTTSQALDRNRVQNATL